MPDEKPESVLEEAKEVMKEFQKHFDNLNTEVPITRLLKENRMYLEKFDKADLARFKNLVSRLTNMDPIDVFYRVAWFFEDFVDVKPASSCVVDGTCKGFNFREKTRK